MSAAKSPRKSPRKSLAERTLNNLDLSEDAATLVNGNDKQVVHHAGFNIIDETISPKRMARRTAKPRKSILKSMSTMNENDTTDFSMLTTTYNHTMTFGQDLKRRVSFAANAHVRMFDKNGSRRASTSMVKTSLKHSKSAPIITTIPRPSLGHARRSSIQSVQSVRQSRFVGEGEEAGEESMDLESDGEFEGDSDAGGTHPGDMALADANEDEEDAGDESDDGGEMEMEMTEVHGVGQISRRRSSVGAESAGDVSDMSDMSIVTSSSTDEEKTMDFTVAVGGLLPTTPPLHASRNRNSIGYSMPESPNSHGNRFRPGVSADGDPADEDDKDGDAMEMTTAYGGVLGDESSSEGEEMAEDGKERTMTFSFGDMSAAQKALDEESMEMTQAHGGLLAQQSTTPAPLSTSHLTRPSATTPSFAQPTISSAGRSREPTPKKRNVFAPSPSPTKAAETPVKTGMQVAGEVAKRLSFGSATSSASKRFSFGASASKKRQSSAMEDVEEASSKKTRLASSTTNIFAPTPTAKKNIFAPTPTRPHHPASSLSRSMPAPQAEKQVVTQQPSTPSAPQQPAATSTDRAFDSPVASQWALNAKSPRKMTPLRQLQLQMSTSKRYSQAVEPAADSPKEEEADDSFEMQRKVTRQTPRKAASAKSPGRSPGLRRILGEHVDPEEFAAVEDGMEPPTITLPRFLEMAGVEFLENLQATRKSLAHGLTQSRPVDGDFDLGDYAEAEVHHLFLNMHTWIGDKMAEDIKAAQDDLREHEEICAVENPVAIQQYLAAPEEERPVFEALFKSYKTNTTLQAKQRWYTWRKDVLDVVRPDLEAVLSGMKEDAARLDQVEQQASGLMPELEARLASLEQELQKERETVKEVAECNQDELADLRAGIAEQTSQINDFTSELNETNTKLAALQQKLDELEQKKKGCQSRIAAAKSKCDQYTRSDILRFKEEYDSLQALHLWKITAMTPDKIELVHDGSVRLLVPCHQHTPDLAASTLEYIGVGIDNAHGGKIAGGKNKSAKQPVEITLGLFAIVLEMFEGYRRGAKSLSSLITQTTPLLTASHRLRSEIIYLNTRLPVVSRSVSTPVGNRAVIVAVPILIKSLRSKMEVNFLFGRECLLGWPGALGGVEVEVRAVYGSADPDMMKQHVSATIAQTTDEGYVGALLQSCVDVSALYEA